MKSRGEEEAKGHLGELLAERYRVLRLLGRGGFGVVFEAEDEVEGGRVALKLLHPHLVGDAEVITRFRREAMAAAALGSPHIVRALDSGEAADGTPYLVMELLQGQDLSSLLAAESPLSVGRATRIAAGVAEALEVAHAAGIVHRDLKPDNVFLVTDTQDAANHDCVKLLDFGVSKFLEKVDTASLMTRTGTAVGTPFYMSPEQAQGNRDLDARADLYALGVILFFSLTGEHPFEDDSYPMLVLKICTEPAPPLTRYRADVPQELSALVHRMLDKERDGRPGSAAEVRAALAPYFDHEETPRRVEGVSAKGVKPGVLSRRPSPLESAPTALGAERTAGRDEPDGSDEVDHAAGVRPSRGRRPLLLGGLLLLVAAAVTAAVLGRGVTPHAPQPVVVRLPTPAPPVERPLGAPAAPGLGWRWVNPRPRAMPSWNDVAVGGVDRVAMVGAHGLVGRFESGALLRWASGLDTELFGVAYTGREQALVVGAHGSMALLDRSVGGRVLRTPTDADLHAVARIGALRDEAAPEPLAAGDAGLSAALSASIARAAGTRAVAVGTGGTMLVVRGFGVTSVDTPTDLDLVGVFASDQAVYAVGERGVVLRLAGGAVSLERPSEGATLRGVGGCPGADLYAVGDGGLVLRRDAEAHWLSVPGAEGEGLIDVACDGDRAVAVGKRGGVFLLSGNRMVRLDSGSPRPLSGVGGAPGASTFVVGKGGRMMTVELDHVRLLTAGPMGQLFDVDFLGGALVAVGAWGSIVRQGMRGLTSAESPTDAALSALTPLDDATLLAFGDRGVALSITWDGVTPLETGSHAGFRDALSAQGQVLVIGTEGSVLRGAPGSFVESVVSDVGTLWAVAGVPDDATAVGDAGVVVHFSQGTAAVSGCEPRVTLRGVARLAQGEFAVGDDGRIARLTPEGCVWEHDGGSTLYGIGTGPEGEPFAVGDDGAAFSRADDGRWTPSHLDAGGVALRRVVTTDRDVYVVGAGGAILRHPRL